MDESKGTQKRIYRIYQCPCCTKFTWDAQEDDEQRGWCSAGIKKVVVLESPKFSLINTPPFCTDWDKGKAKKTK